MGAMLPLLLIFICGVAVGALAMSWIHHSSNQTDAWNKETVLKWKKELNLSEVQQRELETTLDDFGKYYRNVVSDAKERIMGILNEDQRQKFEHILHDKRKS